MIKKAAFSFLFFTFLILILFQFNCSSDKESKSMTIKEMVARGKYLVDFGGCNYCHSPKVLIKDFSVSCQCKILFTAPAKKTRLIKNLATTVVQIRTIFINTQFGVN